MKDGKMMFMNAQDVLNRDQMRMIMGGLVDPDAKSCTSCNSGGVSYGCAYTSVGGKDICTCSVANNDGTGCMVGGGGV